jgi:SAM-dependent methyltransferase
MSTDLDTAKAKEFWEGDESRWNPERCEHWLQHPKVQERLNVLITGHPDQTRYERFLARYFGNRSGGLIPVDRVLTLGSGQGEFERRLVPYRFAKAHDGVDISEAAVADATRLARDAGFHHIHYRAADLNTIELPPCTYDVVFGISAVHHVADFRHLFQQIAVSLKPGAFFLLDEFVGPNQFQWTGDQLAIINEQLAALPAGLKRYVHGESVKGPVARHTIEEMNAVDPSEAVCSADILRLLPEYFEVVEVNGYGGTILHMLLEGIAGNFAVDDPRAMKILDALFNLEDELIASGRIQHDFANIVARRKPTRTQRILGTRAAYAVSRLRARFYPRLGQ